MADFFQIVNSINRKKMVDCKEGEKDEFNAFMLNRWLSCTGDVNQVLRINMFVNPYVFHIQDKMFIGRLMTAACSGHAKLKWIKGPGTKTKKHSLELLQRYFNCSSKEAAGYMEFLSETLFNEIVTELGIDDAEKKICAGEFGFECGGSATRSRSSKRTKKTS